MKYLTIPLILLTLFLARDIYPNLLPPKDTAWIKIFFYQNDVVGKRAVPKGIIKSISAQTEPNPQKLHDRLEEKTRVVVRLYNKDGLKKGDTLYVIDNRNTVVARMIIKSIYKSRSFGYMLIGYGNFRLVNLNDRVVQKLHDKQSRFAYIYKSRGDYYQDIGQTGRAISEYKKAIELDQGNPGAHLSLGYIYYKKELYQFAFNEFKQAYEQVSRLYSNEDKYLLYRGMGDVRFREASYAEDVSSKLKEKYRKEGIRYYKEALKLHSSSYEIYYSMGLLYVQTFDSSVKPDYKQAKKCFEKALKINPAHEDALMRLSSLYKMHNNFTKAEKYAKRALKLNPSNRNARDMLISIKNIQKTRSQR
ncbi:MAG: tetratricopeptide repeat protein [bacterium]|nr:tetratricopeptide repeat protein [bacterium]